MISYSSMIIGLLDKLLNWIFFLVLIFHSIGRSVHIKQLEKLKFISWLKYIYYYYYFF